mgnify:CR=1 FL=1
MNNHLIRATLNDLPVGMRVPFDNGMVGKKLAIEEYDRMTRYRSVEIEEGAVPCLVVLPDGEWLFILVPGENPVWLKPDIPEPFLDAFD